MFFGISRIKKQADALGTSARMDKISNIKMERMLLCRFIGTFIHREHFLGIYAEPVAYFIEVGYADCTAPDHSARQRMVGKITAAEHFGKLMHAITAYPHRKMKALTVWKNLIKLGFPFLLHPATTF